MNLVVDGLGLALGVVVGVAVGWFGYRRLLTPERLEEICRQRRESGAQGWNSPDQQRIVGLVALWLTAVILGTFAFTIVSRLG